MKGVHRISGSSHKALQSSLFLDLWFLIFLCQIETRILIEFKIWRWFNSCNIWAPSTQFCDTIDKIMTQRIFVIQISRSYNTIFWTCKISRSCMVYRLQILKYIINWWSLNADVYLRLWRCPPPALTFTNNVLYAPIITLKV